MPLYTGAKPCGRLGECQQVLKKGGRFAGEMGGFMNCVGLAYFHFAILVRILFNSRFTGLTSTIHYVLESRGRDPVLRDPWYFPSVDDYRKVCRIIMSMFSSVPPALFYSS